jgi:hypothetical protein
MAIKSYILPAVNFFGTFPITFIILKLRSGSALPTYIVFKSPFRVFPIVSRTEIYSYFIEIYV